MKKYIVAAIGFLAFVYLLNPTFGVFELIPDNVPFLGNIDEVSASFLFLSALAYFGYDLRDVFGSWWKRKKVN